MVLQTFQKSSEKSNPLLSRRQIPVKYDWLSTFCILLWNNNSKKIKNKKKEGHIFHFFLMRNNPAKLNSTFAQEMNADSGRLKKIHF